MFWSLNVTGMKNRIVDKDILSLLSESDKLPAPYCDVLNLYYNESLTQKEIGDRMNISLYKVRWHLSKAMYLLRKQAVNRNEVMQT